ncbi:putative T7SS-secreted protein [Streptomyces sp. NPDC000151]|uniref:putative T7SS-secreted protein n=1 Tax=Streptomyces sp. NPDC000151 TaxID=3154244 RepID=UPI003319A6D9
MRRPPAHEWAVLDEDEDPIPGDPDLVAALGQSLRDTAEDISREAGDIKALSAVESWQSKAADKFRETADDTIEPLRKAYHRYDKAAGAMGERVRPESTADWASALEHAQQLADKALKAGRAAHEDHQSAVSAIGKLPSHTPDDDPDRVRLKKKRGEAASDLQKAKSALQDAKEVRDRAAEKAARVIRRAITHDGMHDTNWDKAKDTAGTVLSDTGHLLEDMGEVALSDLASLGNAMLHDAGQVGEVLGGMALVTLGAGGEVGGAMLDVTGVGAVLGVPAGVVSAGAIAGGVGLITAGASQLAMDAAGPNRVDMTSDSGGGGGKGDWSGPETSKGEPKPISEEEQVRHTQRKSDLSDLSRNKQVAEVRKGVTEDGQKYKPEGAALKGGKHGIDWNEGPQRAKQSGNPQGKFGSPADVDYAVRKASELGPGKQGFFDLPPDNDCIEFLPEGATRKPNAMYVKVRPDGTVHAYPYTK